MFSLDIKMRNYFSLNIIEDNYYYYYYYYWKLLQKYFVIVVRTDKLTLMLKFVFVFLVHCQKNNQAESHFVSEDMQRAAEQTNTM